LPKVLDAIVAGAHELLGDEVVALRLVDREDCNYMTIASSVGVSRAMLAETGRTPVHMGAGGRAITENRLIKIHNYPTSEGAIDRFATANLKTAMAAPIHENGRASGSIVVATYNAERVYSDTEAEMLQIF